MNPESTLGTPNRLRPWPLGSPGGLSVLAACIILLGGCGSSTSLVKQEVEYKPATANAFSRAISVGTELKKRPVAKLTAYPALPTDENSTRVRKFVREYAYGRARCHEALLG